MQSVPVILLICLAFVFSIGVLGFFDGVSAQDISTNHQGLPGNLDYDAVETFEIYDERYSSPETEFVRYDIDDDGIDEVIYGSYNGKIVILNDDGDDMVYRIDRTRITTIAVGNVDQDPSMEIVAYTNQTIFCYDISSDDIEWRRNVHESVQLIEMVDEDGDGIEDILLLHESYIRCIDAKGVERYNSTLDVFQESIFVNYRWVIADIDPEAGEEVIIVSYGVDMTYGESGRCMWVFSTVSGDMLFSRWFADVIIISNPLLIEYDGIPSIALSIEVYSGPNQDCDLMIYEAFTDDIIYFDITTDNEIISWSFISLIPGEDDAIVMCSASYHMLVWSVKNEEVLWIEIHDGHLRVNQPPVVCDIDNDGDLEVLISPGEINIFNASTGALEASLEVVYGSKGERRVSVFDFDGDGHSEIIFGYEKTKTMDYYTVRIDTPVFELEIDPGLTSPPETFYASKDNSLGFIIRNMSSSRIPNEMFLHIANDDVGDIVDLRLDLGSRTAHIISGEHIAFTDLDFEVDDRNMSMSIVCSPSWDFPSEELNDVTLGFVDNVNVEWTATFTSTFRVEADLVFLGDLQVEGPRGTMAEGEWTRPGDELTMTGLLVVYEGTEDVFPPAGSFNLSIDHGGVVDESSFGNGPGSSLALRVQSSPTDYQMVLRIHILPTDAYSPSEVTFSLRLDPDAPLVVGFFPENTSWLSYQRITFALQVNDDASGVDTGSARYRKLDPADDTPLGDWVPIVSSDVIPSEDGPIMQTESTFDEGVTVVLWEISDVVGNVLTFRQFIQVDMTSILFDNFTPVGWQVSTHVTCGIEVSDVDGSGVDGSSIQYSYSLSDYMSFTDWIDIDEVDDAEVISIVVEFDGREGKNNTVRFRGRDLAGNEGISSMTYPIWIDSQAPTIDVIHPSDESQVDPDELYIEVVITEEVSGLAELGPHLLDSVTLDPVEVEVVIVNTSDTRWDIRITWDDPGVQSFVFTVQASDRAGNQATTTEIHFWLNRSPSVTITSPTNGTVFKKGAEIQFKVDAIDPDGDAITFEWTLDGELAFEGGPEFTNKTIPAGQHTMTVRVSDGFYTVAQTVDFTVEPSDHEVDDPEYYIYLVVIVVLVGITAAVLWMRGSSDGGES